MMKFSATAKFYAFSFLSAGIIWGILTLCQVEFVNQIFFLTAFVWHFALLTPGLKEKVMTKHHKLSFLAIIVRFNHYLQVFINLKRLPFASSFIRALSPALFTFLLFIVGGNGNILFTFLGSFCFEAIYLILKNKTNYLAETNVTIIPLERTVDLDTPPAIPSEEKSLE